jgi:uncharacterized phiE125 gp8 family phage protein
MWRGITIKVRPSAKPVTIARVKEWLRVDHSSDDDLIQEMIDGAIARIDGPSGIGLALMTQTWQKTFDCFPAVIRLPGWPIKSVSSITYLDQAGALQTLSPSLYSVDLENEPVRIIPALNGTWPMTQAVMGSVKVAFVLGEDDPINIPADLKTAIYMLTAYRYEHREAAGDAVSELPLGVSHILANYNRCAVAA